MSSKKIHVLFADDDQAMRRLFGGQLTNHGFETLYAKDGNEAREMARRFKPDVILLDLHMPVMDGMETAERLRSEKPTKKIPIIMLTNDDITYDAEIKSKDLGIDSYLHKSDDIDTIIERIKKLVKKKK